MISTFKFVEIHFLEINLCIRNKEKFKLIPLFVHSCILIHLMKVAPLGEVVALMQIGSQLIT
jgi:hypothetical protein